MIGTKLGGRYELVQELGRGGMGTVWLARDPVLERDVAVKVLGAGAVEGAARERLRREARVMARMDHPAIVPVHDLGEHDGSLFFVMPVLKGTTLRQRLASGRLRLGEALEIAALVARALEYSHGLGVLHRDIKPENVMLGGGDDGAHRVRVMDFGLARHAVDSRITRTGALVGTVAYLSPEQVAERPVDARSDIYALGTVLYECLAGAPPFQGEIHAILYRIAYENAPGPKARGAAVPDEIDDLVQRCLAKDPARRPATAAEVAAALEGALGRLGAGERELALGAPAAPARPAAAAGEMPFTGREAELAELQRRLTAALDRECQLVLVGGGIGIGKTRLLAEFESLLRARKVRCLHGHFVEAGRGFPHLGFCEIIQDYFRRRADSSSTGEIADLSDVAAELGARFPALLGLENLRAATAAVPDAGPAPASAPGADDRTRLFELLAVTFSRLGGGRPLALLLEDLHHGTVAVEALEYLLRRLGPTPTLIVATFRPEGRDRQHPLSRLLAGLRGDRSAVEIDLGALGRDEHRALVTRFLGGHQVATEVAARLYETTEGNPYFTRELMRSLLDSGVLVREETGVWSVAAGRDLASGVLPQSLQQVVEKQVEDLPPEDREVLSAAAVLGRTFEFRDLEALLDGRTGLDGVVDRLLRRGLLAEEPGTREDRLSFASGLAREALYGRFTRRRRAQLHRKAAAIVEARNAARPERACAQIFHHFAQGDVPEKAVPYGLLAARQALADFSPADAIRAATLVIDLADDERWTGGRAAEAEARLILAESHHRGGAFERATREAEEAAAIHLLEGRNGPAAAAFLLGARAAWDGRRADLAGRLVTKGLDAAPAGSAAPRRDLLGLAATLANLRGDAALGLRYLQEARTLAAEPGPAAGEPARGGRLVVAGGAAVQTCDPARASTTEEVEIAACVFETLLATDDQGHVLPNLAERFEASADGRRFTFVLRRGVRFHDGHEFGAGDVVRSFERALAAPRAARVPALVALGARAASPSPAPEDAGRRPVIRADGAGVVHVDLPEPLPLFPAFLTDPQSALVRVAARSADGTEALAGTGPFRLVGPDPRRPVVARFDGHWRAPALLDEIEFRPGADGGAVAAGLLEGTVDVGRGLLPAEIERFSRDPRWRSGLAEAARKRSHFALFNADGPLARHEAVRRALAAGVRVNDLVWRALGRFGLPAHGLLPPGVLGHDPGRRGATLLPDAARELLRAFPGGPPLRLRAAVHPVFVGQWRPLFDAVLAAWRGLGAEIEVAGSTMDAYLAAKDSPEGLDLLFVRWGADYDDPDVFTHVLFHSASGQLRRWRSGADLDELSEAARAERDPAVRASRYREFERRLADAHALVPLFHDLDVRIVAPRVRGLRMQAHAPFVNYAGVGVQASPPAPAGPRPASVLRAALAAPLRHLDPHAAQNPLAFEVLGNVYETLTRVGADARVGPGLAESFEAATPEQHRFRLREDAVFHDGRRLTARDVRHSFERLLRRGGPHARLLLPVRGAAELAAGKASELAGFHIRSAHAFDVELVSPLVILPHLLAHPACAIVPESTGAASGSLEAAGTGPFRVAEFAPAERVILEAAADARRSGAPGATRLVFDLGVESAASEAAFREGRLDVVTGLDPEAVERLRADPVFGPGFRSAPALATTFLHFNTLRGPLADSGLRRELVRRLDADPALRHAAGRLGVAANGLIPPGLPGGGEGPAVRRVTSKIERISGTLAGTGLSAVVEPLPGGLCDRAAAAVFGVLRAAGVEVRVLNSTLYKFLRAVDRGEADLVLGRWTAEYPDPDSFFHGMHDSRTGLLRAFFHAPAMDDAIARGRQETDPRLRHNLYREVERDLLRNAVLYPLFHDQAWCFVRPGIDGLRLTLSTPMVAYEELAVPERP